MTQSVTLYVDVNVSTEGPAPVAAGLDTMIFVSSHAIGAPARILGPFSDTDEIIDAGFAANSPQVLWATAVFAQFEHVDTVYIGRRDGGDANLTASLAAIKAENPGAAYVWTIDTRTDADIALLAAWIGGEGFGFAWAQTDSEAMLNGTGPIYLLTFGGTPTDGDYESTWEGGDLAAPVTITTTRAAAVPVDDAALAVQHAADIMAEVGPGGDLEGAVLSAEANAGVVTVVTVRNVLDPVVQPTTAAPAPGTLTPSTSDADIAGQLFASQHQRIALVYHNDDTEYMEAAWAGYYHSFDLDEQKGIAAYLIISGVPGDNLSQAEVAAIRSVNGNYVAPAVMSSGQVVSAFTAQGWTPFGQAGAGRRIDIITTIDWAKARFEEDFFGALLAAPRGIRFDNAGIGKFETIARNRLRRGVDAQHFLGQFTVPQGDTFAGLVTPAPINVPTIASLTSAERASRELSFGALAYFAQSIERVVFNFNVRN